MIETLALYMFSISAGYISVFLLLLIPVYFGLAFIFIYKRIYNILRWIISILCVCLACISSLIVSKQQDLLKDCSIEFIETSNGVTETDVCKIYNNYYDKKEYSIVLK